MNSPFILSSFFLTCRQGLIEYSLLIRHFLRLFPFAVPRKVLLEKYEEPAFQDEYALYEETADPHDILDNPKSLAPFPDLTNRIDLHNQSNGNDATLLHHLTSNSIHNSTFSGMLVATVNFYTL